MSRVYRGDSVHSVDPFYLYLDCVETLSPGQVFLLDAAKDDGSSEYQMSLLGVCPVLEIQVKDGKVHLYAVPGLSQYLHTHLQNANFAATVIDFDENAQDEGSRPSAVEGAAYFAVVQSDPLACLEHVRSLLRTLYDGEDVVPFSSGFLGYIGYDAVHYLEMLPKTSFDDRGLPDIRLQFHAGLIQCIQGELCLNDITSALLKIVDEDVMATLRRRLQNVESIVAERIQSPHEVPILLSRLEASTYAKTTIFEDVSKECFENRVIQAKEYIHAGDIFQVVLSKRMRVSRNLHPYIAYNHLRKLNPSPYMFMAEYPDMRLFGASPEAQFRCVNGRAEMKPIAGTSKGRGSTPEEDAALRDKLLMDEKERAEHVMLVDLCRNDLGRICCSGSVEVSEFMVVEPYSHLFHLVSRICGKIKPDVSIFHAVLSTFPAGTLSGAPKIRAMEIIDELESLRRGPYGGMVGMIDIDANANTAIVIRTVVDCEDWYYVQVGAGIVADSDPQLEWSECGHKAGAVIDVLTGKVFQV